MGGGERVEDVDPVRGLVGCVVSVTVFVQACSGLYARRVDLGSLIPAERPVVVEGW